MKWDISPEQMHMNAERTIETVRKQLDDIASTPAGDENLETLLQFEEAFASVRETCGPIEFLKYVSTDKNQRDAADEIEKEAQKFVNEMWSRSDLYKVLVRLEPQMDDFDDEEKLLLQRTLEEFRHRGAALEKDKGMEFLEIANNISVLQSEFNRVLNEVTTKVPCTEKELEGVPKQVYEELEVVDDKYQLPLDYPVYFAVIKYAMNPDTRKRMMIAFLQRGGEDNKEKLEDALALRERQCKLLGHSNFAEYEIKRKMAKTPERVQTFLEDLKVKLAPLAEKEMQVMAEMKARDLEIPVNDVKLEPFDLFYYNELILKENYQIDQNEIKEYFPMSTVVQGVLDVYQTVLNLRFEEVEDANIWHEDVREFQVYDKVSGNLMGVFYLDLYPRDGKFKHYAVFNFLDGRVKDGQRLLPITSMVANFQKPSKTQPSLLTHSEVETFFHEFGHLMHVITGKAKFARFGLEGVLPDFIEVPSQMLENWAWKEEVLELLSGHYKNPEKKLPSEVLKKMIEAKLLNVGCFQLRQVFYASIDMLYHTKEVEDTTQAFLNLFKEITKFDLMEDTTPEASFGHIMSSYAAGYYSYLWSKVYAEDLFTKFEKNGFMDEKTGLEYRETILAPGGSRDPDEMVIEFLGRESNNKAFLKSLGIGE
ncbi:MAG: hypothetical protein BAJATHORv1_30441 [Candidatus Thorarchaeota archaeon]|nr:MAG: hypothetical protein BAJATHORv1_30441 [Candidatus Thorarchaeota archaeon]